jgi:hypothetical protein
LWRKSDEEWEFERRSSASGDDTGDAEKTVGEVSGRGCSQRTTDVMMMKRTSGARLRLAAESRQQTSWGEERTSLPVGVVVEV